MDRMIKETRQKLEQLLAEDKRIKKEILDTKEQLLNAMQKEGIRTLEGDIYTISRAKRVSKSVDEFGFRKWAEDEPEYHLPDFYDEVLNKDRALEVAERELKTNGEVVPWVSVSELEYISPKSKGTK